MHRLIVCQLIIAGCLILLAAAAATCGSMRLVACCHVIIWGTSTSQIYIMIICLPMNNSKPGSCIQSRTPVLMHPIMHAGADARPLNFAVCEQSLAQKQ